MAGPLGLRGDFTAADLRGITKGSRDAAQTRRLLALAAVYDGASRSEAARIAGVTLQVVRDWVLRFNAEGPAGLVTRKAPGARPKITPAIKARIAELVETGPDPDVHGVVRWRCVDLAAVIHAEFGVSLAETSVGQTLRALGYRKLSARPRHHAQDPAALEAFKKTSPPRWQRSKRG